MDVTHNQSSNQDLLCCRACLASGCRLYNIHENKLADALSRISGSLVLQDRLPQYLCTYCCCLLLKCASFRATCLATEKLLSLNLLNGERNTDSILRLDRPSHRINLTLSVVNILEYVETPTTDLKQEPNDVVNTDESTIDTAAKSEGNIDINNSNLSEKSIDNVNLGLSSIDDDNIGVSSINDEDIDSFYVHSNKQDAGSKNPRVTKKNEAKINDNIAVYEENRLLVNKEKTVKTYKKKIGTTTKKKLIEIQGHCDKVNVKNAKNDDVGLEETCIDANSGDANVDGVNLGKSKLHYIDLSEPNIDDINLSEPDIDDINLSEPHIDDINLSESDIDDNNLSERDIGDINLSEPDIDDNNLSERDIDDTNLSEQHIDDTNLSERDIDDTNLSEPHIDDINLSKPDIDVLNLSEQHIDDINLSEPHIDDINLSKPDIDVLNLSEPHIDDINLTGAHPGYDHIDIVDVHKIIKKADPKKQRVNKKVKKDTVESKDNDDNDDDEDNYDDEYNDEEDARLLNNVKTLKTYTRKIGTRPKKNMIEIQGYSDQVNDKTDKVEVDIDLNEADIEKLKRNINVRYTNPDLAEDESDIEDINEIEARMEIVNIEYIVKKAVKRPNTTVKKKKSDNAVTPVKRGRSRKKKRKLRDPENDYLPVFDFSKVERDLNVKIVILSKQEQLEEIAERKKSRNYTASQYKCEDCGRGFDGDATYSNHRRKHSPSAGPESCSICSLRYKRLGKRNVHEDMHRLKFICQECGAVTRSRVSAKAHHEIHEGRWFACKHCDKRFRNRQTCLSHVRLTHFALNVACNICGETYVGEQGLNMHKSITHPETKSQRFKCTTCSASFVSLDALNRHTDSGEHAGSPCEQCGESCASEDALRAHVGEEHPSESHWCEECAATFSTRAAFDVHYRRKHLEQRAAAPRARKRGAGAGAGSGAGAVAGGGAPASPAPRGQVMCEQCGHIAVCWAKFREHQNRHLAVKPYPCPHCPKTFPSRLARTCHIRLHTGEKPFKCPECPMTFNLQGNRKRHHDVVHLKILAGATACHVCARVFTTKGGMRLHVRTVHNGQPGPKRNRKRKIAS